jgi:pimeloyl-ACP methyl ester carboxylesterase
MTLISIRVVVAVLMLGSVGAVYPSARVLSVPGAEALSGTWSGGTNATGRWLYAEAHLDTGAQRQRPTLDVVGAQAAGLALNEMRLDGDRLTFRIPTVLGVMSFDGILRDGVIEGGISGAAPGAKLHLMRTSPPLPSQSDAAVGRYALGGIDEMLVAYRPFGQLGVTIVERAETGEKLKRIMHGIPVGADRYVTSTSLVESLQRSETLTLERNRRGAVTAIRWERPDAAPRTAQKVTGLLQRAVHFAGPAGPIAGTLFLPEGRPPFPAVALIGGSGPTTRDNLLVRAREFARIGVAALTWDKRGNGETAGDYQLATLEDLADDAVKAVEFLMADAAIDAKRVGLQGHSQGGWIAPLAISRARTKPAWLIVSSGGPTPPAEQEAWRARTQARAAGASDEDAGAAEAFMRRKWAFGFGEIDWPGYQAHAKRALGQTWGTLVSPILSQDPEAWAFIRSLKAFDPVASVKQLRLPTLVLFGDGDDEQPVEITRANWVLAFQQSAHMDYAIVVFPGATHSLWIGRGNAIAHPPTDTIRAWLTAHGILR